MAVAHRAVDLGLGRQRRDRIDDHYVDRSRLHELFAYRERLFAARRLRHDEAREVDAYLPRVCRIERVLRVDERSRAARFLDIRHSV